MIIQAVSLLLISSPLYAGGGTKIVAQLATSSRQATPSMCARAFCAASGAARRPVSQVAQAACAIVGWNRYAWAYALPPARFNTKAAASTAVQLADAAALNETIESVLDRLHTASRMVLDDTEASAFTVTFETHPPTTRSVFYKQEHLLAALTRIKQGLGKLPRHAYGGINLDWTVRESVLQGTKSHPIIAVSMFTSSPNESLQARMPSYFWSSLYRVVGIKDNDHDAEDDLSDGPYAK